AVEEHGTHAVVHVRAEAASHVTGRRLDLDHVGAELRQQLRGVRARDDGRQVDHADAGERCDRHGRRRYRPRLAPVRRRSRWLCDSPGMVVEYEVRGRTALVTLNRPEARNAVNGEVAQGLEAAVDRMEADDDVWCGVLAAEGSVFCAGADLKLIAA